MSAFKLEDSSKVEGRDVDMEGAEQVRIKWLLSEKDGTPHFQMRLFELAPGGHTPYHAHAWEHEVFIVSGEGKLIFEGEDKPFAKGFFMFVPAGREHSFVNTGDTTLEFLCMIPNTCKKSR